MRPLRCAPVCLAFILLLVTQSEVLEAQDAKAAPSEAPRFADVDSSLSAVENGLRRIERSKTLDEQFDPERALDSYRRELRKVYDATMQATLEDARKSEAALQTGRKVETSAPAKRLQAWEKDIVGHRTRMEKVVARLTEINMKIRDGSIMIAPGLFKTLPKEEVEELRQWLTPEAIRKYQSIDRSLFGSLDIEKKLPQRHLASGIEFARPGEIMGDTLGGSRPAPLYRPRGVSRSLLAWLGDFIQPRAEAVVAVGCVVVCVTATPAACVACVAGAIGYGALLTTQLDNALAGCEVFRTRTARAICKAVVIGGVIEVIG